MSPEPGKITVYYDGACPKCIKDRGNYERLAGERKSSVHWVDITARDTELQEIGIDPQKALTELHVIDENNNILSEIDAYIALMGRVPVLLPLAWFIGLPIIRPLISRLYHWQVDRRLRREGRL